MFSIIENANSLTKKTLSGLKMGEKGQAGIAAGAAVIASLMVVGIMIVITQVVIDNVLNATNLNSGLYALLPTLFPVLLIMALISALFVFFVTRR